MKWALVIESSLHGYYVSEIREAEQQPPYHPSHLRLWHWIMVPSGEDVRVGDIWTGECFHPPQVSPH